ncbi:MAG TPA: aldehyde ferredoxin oxidoreductase family protein [Dehalococcoidia bacterium]|nr:aldehyde ferredoxin oxidoreductase family protein [Dehalococcoidia bacterium]
MVDLTAGRVTYEDLALETLHTYLGGRGLGVKLLTDRLDPRVDPLSPDNLIVFAVGPLTGTNAPTAGRFSVVTKSPLTGTIFDANSGGFWGPDFKACGFDALLLYGASDRPVYLDLSPGRVEIREADDLWGLDVPGATDLLRARHGKTAKIATIGPAGENLVRMAAIMNDYHRAAARGGVGAVLGSKRVKALVASARRKVELADRDAYLMVVKEAQRLIAQSPITSKALPEYGTASLMGVINQFGLLGTKNFQQGTFAQADAISGEAITDQILVRKKPCYACPIACGRETHVGDKSGEGPEFETIYAFGPMCLVGDLEQVTTAGFLCNELGLDTISVGVTISCAIELAERGLLDTDLTWGDGKRFNELITAIAHRQGLGDRLAEGSLRLAQSAGAPEVAMQTKGLEMPAYDPRGSKGMGLAYATSNRGACHLRAYFIGLEILGLPKRIDRLSPDNKGGLCVLMQNLNAAMDSLIECRFVESANNEAHYARQLSAATGVSYEPEELMVIGERIWTLERLFNNAAGFTRADDTLPPRLLHEPLSEGMSKGQVVELDPMLDDYYRARGWDDQGRPTPAKLAELGLSELSVGKYQPVG